MDRGRPAMVAAAVLVGPGEIEVRTFPEPAVPEDAATVRVELCGVCGTDRKYLSGALPAPYPLILGHEIVGRVERIGPRAAERWGLAAGERVLVESSIPCWTCSACRTGAYRLCPTKGGYGTRTSTSVPPGLWGGMSEVLYLAPESIVHALPDAVGPAAAVAVPLLANGVMWLTRQGGARAGDRVLIQGCGPQGLAAALVARVSGAAEVVVTGLRSDAARLAFAGAVGARTEIVDPDAPPEDRLRHIGIGYDVVLDVSGSATAIAEGPSHLRPQGTFVLAGLVGKGKTVAFRTDDLAYREIRIQGVLSKDEAAMRTALALVLRDPWLAERAGELVTHTYPLEAAAEAIRALDAAPPGFVKAAVRPA